MVLPTIISSSPLDGTSLAPSSGSGHVDTRCLLNMWPMRHTYRVPTGPIFWTKLQRSEEALWIICPALFISCYFHKPAFPSTAKLPIWGGGAQHESCYGCAWLPKGHEEAPTPSPAGSLQASLTALWHWSCCPPAGPLASGPGCQPASRGSSLAGSQLSVPELAARR